MENLSKSGVIISTTTTIIIIIILRSCMSNSLILECVRLTPCKINVDTIIETFKDP